MVIVWIEDDKAEVSEIRLEGAPVRLVSCGIAIAIAAHAAPSALMLAAAIFPENMTAISSEVHMSLIMIRRTMSQQQAQLRRSDSRTDFDEHDVFAEVSGMLCPLLGESSSFSYPVSQEIVQSAVSPLCMCW